MENLPPLQSHSEYQPPEIQQLAYKEFGLGTTPVFARFYIGAEKDAKASEEANGPVYQEKVFVLLQVAGERDNQTVVGLFDGSEKDHRRLYPEAWALFERNREKRSIPLSSLPKMRPAIVEAFKELDIHNVADVIAKPVPEYLLPYKKWAQYVQSIHDMADGKPKLRVVA